MFCWSIDEDIDLRIFEIRHVPELFSLTDGNRKHLIEWLPWVRETHSASDTERFVRAALQQFAGGEGFHAGIWYRGELAGAVGLHRVEIRCGFHNHSSRAIPRKLGFREEGVLRAAQWLGDRWTDIVVYGKLTADAMGNA